MVMISEIGNESRDEMLNFVVVFDKGNDFGDEILNVGMKFDDDIRKGKNAPMGGYGRPKGLLGFAKLPQ